MLLQAHKRIFKGRVRGWVTLQSPCRHKASFRFQPAAVDRRLRGAQTYNGFSKGLMATFIFGASERFDRAVAEPGDNLTNLLQGLSKKKGLGRLFAQLSTLAWAVAASQVLGSPVCKPYT